MPVNYKLIFWIILSVVLFAFFLWLFRIAVPGIAVAFATGTTVVVVSGLIAGHVFTKLAIRSNLVHNTFNAVTTAIVLLLVGCIAIAFLLNSMIGETTFFPFAITVMLLFIVCGGVGFVVTIIRNHYRSTITTAHAAAAQSKSELQLLQAQLSPHFLFNTLNNLYGLSMSEPSRLPTLLLKLSDLLRYSVYEVKELYVPLQHEVDYIANYVDFERLRLGDKLQLSLNLDAGKWHDCLIPPLMLIVFVENAFKHSRAAGDQLITIDINLALNGSRLTFSVKNPVSSPLMQDGKNSGFGLESVRKRLNLLYPSRHNLKIESSESTHTVYLELECQKNSGV